MAINASFITIKSKRTENVNLKDPIYQYVQRTFDESKAKEIEEDLVELDKRRSAIVTASGGGWSSNAKEQFQMYYRAASLVESRFPISKDKSNIQVAFTWTDSFLPKKKVRQSSIHFDKAAVLFNLAALLSQRASNIDTSTSEGYVEASTCLREAAGLLNETKNVASKLDHPKPLDMSPECLEALERLMLAQAQELSYYKTVKEKKSQHVLSLLSKQCSVFYAETLLIAGSPALKDEIDKKWLGYIQNKSWLLEASAQYHASQEAREKDDIATEICRLRHLLELVNRIRFDISSKTPNILNEVTRNLTEVSRTRLERADKDNATVFLVKIPDISEIPKLKGHSLVKPLDPSNGLDASEEKLFENYIPEACTKALSRYSELVDQKARVIMDKLNGATDDARIKLKEWELPEKIEAIHSFNIKNLPENIKEELNKIEEAGGYDFLVQLSCNKVTMRQNISQDLQTMEQRIEFDKQTDANLSKQNKKYNLSLNSKELNGYRQLMNTYKKNLSAADKTDNMVEEKLKKSENTLRLLSTSGILELIPKLEQPMLNLNEEDPMTIVSNIKHCLNQLNEMGIERAGLEDELKDFKLKDNILMKIMAAPSSSYEELFKTELKKYDEIEESVDDVILKQNEVLSYLEKSMRKFKTTFNIEDWEKKLNDTWKKINTHMALYNELNMNFSEGVTFYTQLQEAVSKLDGLVTTFLDKREIQRSNLLEKLKMPPVTPGQQVPHPSPFPNTYSGDINTQMANMNIAQHPMQYNNNAQHHMNITGQPSSSSLTSSGGGGSNSMTLPNYDQNQSYYQNYDQQYNYNQMSNQQGNHQYYHYDYNSNPMQQQHPNVQPPPSLGSEQYHPSINYNNQQYPYHSADPSKAPPPKGYPNHDSI